MSWKEDIDSDPKPADPKEEPKETPPEPPPAAEEEEEVDEFDAGSDGTGDAPLD